MPIVNNNELAVVGLQRCGQHALIHWVLAQARGRRVFLNDVVALEDPFTSFSTGEIETRGFWRFDLAAERAGRHARKNWLIFNYEDMHPGQPFRPAFEARREEWLGASARRFHLLVLRDPFNFFASRLRWARSPSAGWSKRPLTSDVARAALVELWKAHAREFLGDTRLLPEEKVVVSYNRWVGERDYRRALAARLGLRFSDRGRSHVPDYGPGSSFDGRRFHWRAGRMRVLERFRHFEQDAFFRAIFDDAELLDLSRRAFGHVPGSEVLLGPRAA
jgi:hypothetical protein